MLMLISDYIKAAMDLAVDWHNDFVTPEHVMYVIIEDKQFEFVMDAIELDKRYILSELDGYFEYNALNPEVDFKVESSNCLVGVLDDIDKIAEADDYVMITDLMIRLYHSGSEVLKGLFDTENIIDRLKALNNEMHSTMVKSEDSPREVPNSGWIRPINDLEESYPKSKYIVSREEYINKIMTFLGKTERSHVCLVGDLGVGKESIILDLIKQTNPLFAVVELDLEYLLCSPTFVQNCTSIFERVKSVMKASQMKSKDKIGLLRVKNLSSVLASNNPIYLAFSNILLGDSLSFSIICDLPFEDVEFVKDDRTFINTVNFINVVPPTDEEAFTMLKSMSRYYSNPKFNITDEAIKRALDIAKNRMKSSNMLAEAESLLDEANVRRVTSFKQLAKESAKDKSGSNIDKLLNCIFNGITEAEVEDAYKYLHKVEGQSLAIEEEYKLISDLKTNLKSEIFGQDKAIDAVVKQIELSKAGLLDDNKPIGSFIFVGPTGVGKTQLAKSLAKQLKAEFIKYDMSEFQESHSISKMIGAPAGYVGYDQGGSLVHKINKNPKAVLLLDEIEKAHPNVYNMLLQIMDDAVITDGKQEKADFKDVVLIMTSNAGAVNMQKRGVGFNNQDFHNDEMGKAVDEIFAPEFRGRLSAVVEFNSLDKSVYNDIVRKELRNMGSKLSKRSIKLDYSDDVVEFISNNVETDKSGARQIEAYIRDNVAVELGHRIISGIPADTSISIKVEEGKLVYA